MTNNHEDQKNEQDDVRKVIQEAVRKNQENLTPEESQKLEQVMIDIFENGLFPGEALGFNQDFLDYVYKFAYGLYQKNQIEEASQLYRWLKRMSPLEQKYTVALAHCFIMQKNWLPAVALLMELAYLNPEDPLPFEKMCDCLIEAHDLPGALVAIDKAIERAGDKKEYSTDKEKWLMTFDYIVSQLDIDPAIVEKAKEEREDPKKAKKA